MKQKKEQPLGSKEWQVKLAPLKEDKNMMKKIKNMKKNTVVSIAMVLVFAILLTSGTAVFNWSGAATQKKTTTTKVKKPGQVKGLKLIKGKPLKYIEGFPETMPTNMTIQFL